MRHSKHRRLQLSAYPIRILLCAGLAAVLVAQAPGGDKAQEENTPDTWRLIGSCVDAAGGAWAEATIELRGVAKRLADPRIPVVTQRTRSDARGRFVVELRNDLHWTAWAHAPAESRSGSIVSVAADVTPESRRVELQALAAQERPQPRVAEKLDGRAVTGAFGSVQGQLVALPMDETRRVRIDTLPGEDPLLMLFGAEGRALLSLKASELATSADGQALLAARPRDEGAAVFVRFAIHGPKGPIAGAEVYDIAGQRSVLRGVSGEDGIATIWLSVDRSGRWPQIQGDQSFRVLAPGCAESRFDVTMSLTAKGKPRGSDAGIGMGGGMGVDGGGIRMGGRAIRLSTERNLEEMRKEGRSDLTVTLQENRRVIGRLLWKDDIPVAGIPVLFDQELVTASTSRRAQFSSSGGVQPRIVMTDAEGRFDARYLNRKHWLTIRALLPLEERRRHLEDGAELAPEALLWTSHVGPQRAMDLRDFVLSEQPRMRIRVHRANMTPAKGALLWVSARQRLSHSFWQHRLEGWTGSGGVFRLIHAAPTQLELVAREGQSYAYQVLGVAEQRGERILAELELTRPLAIEGRCVNEDGKPMANVHLQLDQIQPKPPEALLWLRRNHTSSDAQGRFTIPLWENSTCRLLAWAFRRQTGKPRMRWGATPLDLEIGTSSPAPVEFEMIQR
jgi:hypothetical protein